MKPVVEKFLRYSKIDTQSDPNSRTTPSTVKQFNLANKLKHEFEEMDISNVKMSDKCHLTATLKANTKRTDIPKIGFIAHMDTSPDAKGDNVKAKIIENYDGTPIPLDDEQTIFLSPKDFPELKKYIGNSIITTDGKTLLGADDKAGIAEIMTAIEYLVKHPEIEHGDVKIAFTPDEEIGKGADFFNVEKFNADFAYTIDGGEIGELEYENFNAAQMTINIQGRSVHPGTAKNKMINALELGMEYNNNLPKDEKPENTEKYQGFFHLVKMEGKVEEATLSYIIRDHDKKLFQQKKQLAQDIATNLNNKYPRAKITCQITDQYYNMREKIEPVMYIVSTAKQAIIDAGIKPIIKPIRGGTDGSKLSFMGLPCPNIFTGGHNFHGPYEYIPIESMEKATEVIINIIKLFAENKTQI